MNTKFSVAVHVLILISESKKSMNSDEIAVSVGTNASYIRKVLGLLKKSHIIEGHRGVAGYILKRDSSELTFLEIYQSVMETDEIHILDIHQNPNDQCIVGYHIKPILENIFLDLESSFAKQLKNITLLNCINEMKQNAIKSRYT